MPWNITIDVSNGRRGRSTAFFTLSHSMLTRCAVIVFTGRATVGWFITVNYGRRA